MSARARLALRVLLGIMLVIGGWCWVTMYRLDPGLAPSIAGGVVLCLVVAIGIRQLSRTARLQRDSTTLRAARAVRLVLVILLVTIALVPFVGSQGTAVSIGLLSFGPVLGACGVGILEPERSLSLLARLYSRRGDGAEAGLGSYGVPFGLLLVFVSIDQWGLSWNGALVSRSIIALTAVTHFFAVGLVRRRE